MTNCFVGQPNRAAIYTGNISMTQYIITHAMNGYILTVNVGRPNHTGR